MESPAKQRELAQLKERIRQLESELAAERPRQWPPREYYFTYYVLAGSVLGMFGAATSLLFNVVGAFLLGEFPLQLIRVYLTFPLGEKALQVNSGLTLALGCILYLGTGMLLGIPFHLLQSRLGWAATFKERAIAATILALLVWIVNFYFILSWLQPLLFGQAWIVRLVPWYVAASTHLVFGWTMLAVYPLGVFEPYKVDVDAPAGR